MACSSFRKVAGELVGLPRVKGVKDIPTLADLLFATIRDLKTLRKQYFLAVS